MSCYLVSKYDIDVLVEALADRGAIYGAERDAIGRMLWIENAMSVSARYRTPFDTSVQAYTYTEPCLSGTGPDDSSCSWSETGDLVEHTARRYRYQACEHDGWDRSLANAAINLLLDFPEK